MARQGSFKDPTPIFGNSHKVLKVSGVWVYSWVELLAIRILGLAGGAGFGVKGSRR